MPSFAQHRDAQEPTLLERDFAYPESLGLFQKILLTTDGTVTRLLELYTGEKIKVQKLEQNIRVGNVSPILNYNEEGPILYRRILLCGRVNKYVYAESALVFERLSRDIQYGLLETDIPIGLMWKQEKTDMYREVIECKIESCEKASAALGQDLDVPLLARTYLVFSERQPFGVITEKFPVTFFTDKEMIDRF